MGIENIQLPPNELSIEKSGLAMLCNDISKIDFIDEHCFYWDNTKKIFNAIKTAKSTDFTIVAVASGLDPDVVIDLTTDLISESSYEYIISELNKYKNARTIIRGLNLLENQARGLEIEKTKETLKKLDSLILGIEQDKTIIQHGVEYFEDIGTEKKEIQSGYKILDESLMLNGGQLVTIAGRPSMGKTTVMQNIALRQSKDWNVGFISMEMKVFELLDRFVCIIGGLSSYDIKNKSQHKDTIMDYLSTIMEKKLFITENIYTLAKIEQYIVKNNLDICYIDYLGLIQYGDSKMPTITRISEITRQLKLMAKQRNCLIVLGSQLSRGVDGRNDKRPILSDLRDSGTIEQDSDIVIMLFRDEYYDEGSEDKNKIELIIRKQRNGELKTVKLDSKFGSYRILDKGIIQKPF